MENTVVKNPHIKTIAKSAFFIFITVLLLMELFLPTRPAIEGLSATYRTVREPSDIKAVSGPLVAPIVYIGDFSFPESTIEEKKARFISLMLPTVLISKHKLSRQRERVKNDLGKNYLRGNERKWLVQQVQRFQADDYDDLLSKMAVHPTSIVLAQAALESGWGESNFFRNAHNVFGVWSFDSDEPRVKASQTRQGKNIYVRQYPSLIESVDDYFLAIACGPYENFRQARLVDDPPEALLQYLTKYSEQREEYVKRLRQVIQANDLERFDTYELDF